MKEFIQAAIEAAARSGVQAAVVFVSPEAAASEVGVATAEYEAVSKDRDEAVSTIHQLEARIQDLEVELIKAKAVLESKVVEVVSAPVSVVAPAPVLDAQLAKLQSDLAEAIAAKERLEKDLREKPSIESAQVVSQPAEVVKDDAAISLLGLDAPVEKRLKKLGFGSIGLLQQALVEGKLKENKFKKDAVLLIASKLLGVPRGPQMGAAAVPVSAPEAVNHPECPWEERLAAAFRKKRDMLAEQTKLAQLEKEMLTDPSVKPKRDEAERQRDLHYVQQLALVFSMGLDPKTKDIDAALIRAGCASYMRKQDDQPKEAVNGQ